MTMKTQPNAIIQRRLNQLIAQRDQLIQTKKSERTMDLKKIHEMIARLKSWREDSHTRITPEQTPEHPEIFHGMSQLEKAFRKITSDLNIPPRPKTNLDKVLESMNDHCPGHHTNIIMVEPTHENTTKTPEITFKSSHATDKWPKETPKAFQARIMDVRTAFRKMNGWD